MLFYNIIKDNNLQFLANVFYNKVFQLNFMFFYYFFDILTK